MRSLSILIGAGALLLSAQPAWSGVGADLADLCLQTNGDEAAFKAVATQRGMVAAQVPADYQDPEINSVAFRRPEAKPDELAVFSTPVTQKQSDGTAIYVAACIITVVGNSDSVTADISKRLQPALEAADGRVMWLASMADGEIKSEANIGSADAFIDLAKKRTTFRIEQSDEAKFIGVVAYILGPPR